MTYRSALCSHCARASADSECARCRDPVCGACAEGVCPRAGSREHRLGVGARLRVVDRGGRFGVVTTWRRAVRVFDLQRGQYVDAANEFPVGRAPFGAVTRGGCWVGTVPRPDSRGAPWVVGLSELGTGSCRGTYLRAPTHITMCDRDETVCTLLRDETIALMAPDGRRLRIVDPHGTEVTQALAFDARTQLLWTGAHSRILASRVADRVRGDERANRRYTTKVVHRFPLDGEDVLWLRAVGDRVAYATRWMWGASEPHAAFDSIRLRVYDIAEHGVSEQPRLDITGPPSACVDLSLDGRHVAIPSSPSTVDVYDLESRTKQVLAGHSDLVHFVWFTDGGGLITADYDNRVITWQRVGARYLPLGEPGPT